jgi:hypothetical protein
MSKHTSATVIADSRINKTFTVVEIEQPHFKDLGVVESATKRNQNLKITQGVLLKTRCR